MVPECLFQRLAAAAPLYPPGKALSARQPFSGALLLSLALPGFAFLLLGRRLLGWLFVAGYLIAALVFVAALGFPAASVGYGLLISLHATSIMFVEDAWLKESRLGRQAGRGLLHPVCGLGVVLCAAGRLRRAPLVYPVAGRGSGLRSSSAEWLRDSIRRGEWLVYEITGNRFGDHGNNVVLHSGWGVDPVLALPGDRVRFTPEAYFVNGQAFARAPHMPAGGEWVVPEKCGSSGPALI